MADAERIIEDERAREERRARKKKRKAERKIRKKRSGRRSASPDVEKDSELVKSPTPRLEMSEPPADLREIRDAMSPAASSPMQEASVSPISATVSSAREEQAAAIAESASPLKYPRKRPGNVMAVSTTSDSTSPPVAESSIKPLAKPVVAKAVASPLAKSVAKPVEPVTKVINSSAKKKTLDTVTVDRRSGSLKINEDNVRHNEFREATVLVTSLAHLHRKKHDDETVKEESAPQKTQTTELAKVRGRRRNSILKHASKAW